MEYYLGALKKYAVFTGRATRAEYWYFMLFNFIVSVGATIIDMFTMSYSESTGVGLFLGLYILGTLVPGFAVSVRRLHDANHSGWWMLLGIVPIIGLVVTFLMMLCPSDTESNKYGDLVGPDVVDMSSQEVA